MGIALVKGRSTPSSLPQVNGAWPAWLEAGVPKFLYGMRLASAVSLALFIAFYLQLDNPSWAGTSAAVVCQPVLGASLRKGFFRIVGTATGATMSLVLFGLFPQDRVGFLVGMALWAAACSFGNTLTRNFSAYAFALSGYTLAIIAGDAIPNPDQAFHLAVTRGSEIVIGIACAMTVTSLSEIGGSRSKLAAAIDGLGREILDGFGGLLRDPAHQAVDGPDARRALIAGVAGLDPVIDQALGEDPELRQRAAILRNATAGLLAALSGWRMAESHLVHLPRGEACRFARHVADLLPDTWRGLGGDDLAAARELAALKSEGWISQFLLADAAARVALGLAAAANGLDLLRGAARARDPSHVPGFVVADYLPALVNALRTFAAVSAALTFWTVTEWPNGLGAVTFLAITVLLMTPQQEKSGKAALGYALGTVLTACLAAIVDFALLPNHESFFALAVIMSSFLIPLAALSTVPALAPYLVAATMNFVPLVAPANEIAFDTLSFYNSALGIVGGCLAGALSLVLIPPVPKVTRARRLVFLTLRDLRGLASGRWSTTSDAWQHRIYARLVAVPKGVDPMYGAHLLAALSTGMQMLRLRALTGSGAAGDHLRTALNRFAARDVDGAMAGLGEAGAEMEADGRADPRISVAIQGVFDALRQHRRAFGEA